MPVTRCRKVVYHPTKQLGLGGAAMSTNGSTEARKLRSRLDHPIIDADGHWIEYLPVMREEFRRIGGDAAVEALAVATDRVPNALRMSLPERRRRRVGMEACRPAVIEAVRRGEGLEGDSNSTLTGGLEDLDDYFRCKIGGESDIRDLFVPRFYFGCEADDPVNAWAFNRRANPMNARLNALFSSDIGHFDVPDMTDVVPEAYELVEHELISSDDFRDFMFTNAVRFWGEVNPDFFKGTAVEKQAAETLARPASVAAVR